MNYPLGIDVGTTYTAAALWDDGRAQTVPLGDRANAVPSVLFLREDGAVLVGEAAARRGVLEPDRVAREFKRRMGDDVPVLLGGRRFPVHELTGRILRTVVDRVSEQRGGPPGHVVLTHPAEWGGYRRRRLAEASRAAGLTDVGLLPEPVAAATWYAAQERVEPGALIAIYDFGGGTFDASVVRKTADSVEIHGEPGGDDRVGGIDFDHALFRRVCANAGVDPARLDPGDSAAVAALAQLFASVVEAKEALSADVEVRIPVVLPGITRQVLITRAEFEDLIRSRLEGTVGVFGQVVRRAGVAPSDLHAVLLVGGSSRIPLVRTLLSAELGIRVAVDAHPKYTVSLGAAIAAAPRVAGPPAPPPRPPVPVRSRPEVSAPVDLVRTGLTGAPDVLVPVVLVPPAAGRPREVVRTRRDGAVPAKGHGRLVAVLVTVLVLGVVAAVAFFATRPAGDAAPKPSALPAPGGPGTTAAETLRLTGELVVPPDGADVMRAVTRLPSGTLVAVGLSAGQQPRAWLRRPGGAPAAVSPPPGEGQAALADVVTSGSGVVAVGWAGTGRARRPAVWLSATGEQWQLLPAGGSFVPGGGVTELTAVTAGGDGRLYAAGVDRGSDTADGDVAIFASPDGKSWDRLPATGLAGPGPQTVTRLIRTADGRFLAAGSALTGARRGPALWTSPDGIAWTPDTSVPAGSPTVLGLTREADGTVLACGSVGPADQPSTGCWTRSGSGSWRTWTVTGTPAPVYVYGVVSTPDGLVLAGVGREGSTVDAGLWTVRPG
ncbi:Hsp70 family protein [Amycolatopsis sp. cg9]|uniref:Hsp70 family protein n=1 Tax=Amycolatopsis sp. cg9 TaxID=3238801 RepID=UPI003525B772